MVHTLRIPSVLRTLPEGTPSVVHEVRQYCRSSAGPILVSLDAAILWDLHEKASVHTKMHQPVREAYALVNYTFHDAMFLNYGDTWYYSDGTRANYGETWYYKNGTKMNY